MKNYQIRPTSIIATLACCLFTGIFGYVSFLSILERTTTGEQFIMKIMVCGLMIGITGLMALGTYCFSLCIVEKKEALLY